MIALVLAFVFQSQSTPAPKPPLSAASAQAILRRASSLRARHQLAQAEAALQPLLAHSPADAQALVLLADINLDQGRRDQAIALFTQALAAYPSSLPANNAIGSSLAQSHHWVEAMDRFETVLALAPHDSIARRGELDAATQLALESLRNNQPEAALQVLDHARTRLPDDPQLLLEIGNEQFDLHLLSAAAQAFAAALILAPRNPDILYALAQVELEQQHLPAAEQHLRTYLALKPGDASAHYALGHVLQMQLRTQEAAAEFNQSIALQPVQTESYYQLGQLALDDRRDPDAAPLFQRTIVRNPVHGGALTGLGILAYRAHDYTRAADYLRQATAASPDYQPAHYYLGLTLARLNDREASQRELDLARQLAASQQGKAKPVTPETAP